MIERVFSKEGATVTVKYQGTEAWLDWAEASNPMSLIRLIKEAHAFLVAEGVKRCTTSVSAMEQPVYDLAVKLGFVPWEIVMVLPLTPMEP